MFKWVRSWFVWQFSLTRLVIAVVFLGALLGLNMRRIGPKVYQVPLSGRVSLPPDPNPTPTLIVRHFRGWPFPFTGSTEALSRRDAEMNTDVLDHAPAEFLNGKDFYESPYGFFESPWTHRTYYLISSFRNAPGSGPESVDLMGYITLGTIDALLALTVLTLILFYHPRHNPKNLGTR